ncbi:MAG: Ig-like domain-containing protein [Bacilli bacterium]|nr:Ig-like domain-containing protein [Bacilli bacterium]
MKKKEIIILLVSCVIIAIIGTLFGPKTSNDYESYGEEVSVSSKNSFELEHSILYCYVGDKETIKIKNYDNNNSFSWSSIDDDIVSVDGKGNINCLKEGQTNIVVEKNIDDSSECLIVVVDKNKMTKEEAKKEDYNRSIKEKNGEKKKEETGEEEKTSEPVIPTNPSESTDHSSFEVQSINISESSIELYTLDTYKINASVNPSNASDKKLTYKSSNEKLLTVDSNGNVKALMAGSCYVTITSSNNKSVKVNFNIISKERIHFISNLESNGSDYDTGDAILLESNGHFAMIDMGNTENRIANNVVNYLKSNNVSVLDFVLITHMHSDHAGNLQTILENDIIIKNIWVKDYSDSFYTDETTLKRFNKVKKLANKYSANIKYVDKDGEGKNYTFKYLKFNMTLYNNTKNVNSNTNENYSSIVSLIEVNNHKVLLTSDMYDTKMFNEIASSIGKIGIMKVPHHGSRKCALLSKKYDGNIAESGDNKIESTAISSLNPKYFIVTSSKKKIDNIIKDKNITMDKMCVSKIPSDKTIYYVDENTTALVIDLSGSSLKFSSR